MRLIHAILTTALLIGCGSKTPESATPGNTGGTAATPPPARKGFVVTAKDTTGGGHEAQLQADAEKHLAALPHIQELDALGFDVELVGLDRTTTIVCRVRIGVSTMSDQAMIASVNSSATVDKADDVAAGDCLEAVVGDMIDKMISKLIEDRLSKQQAGSGTGK
jgi:hypothetical protein